MTPPIFVVRCCFCFVLITTVLCVESNNNNDGSKKLNLDNGVLNSFTDALTSFFAPHKKRHPVIPNTTNSNAFRSQDVARKTYKNFAAQESKSARRSKEMLRDSLFIYPQAQATGDVCELPQVIGTGPYRIPRWYYNPNTRRCELFYYSGCCGNGNNFPTYESCQVLCEVDPCTQPKDSGVGSLQIPRFNFNQMTKMCEHFVYYGSGGNRNNFATLSECRTRCPESPNPCAFGEAMRAGTGGSMQCGFSQVVTNTCPVSFYCHVGSTVSTTICCPKPLGFKAGTPDKCIQPLRLGVGSESLPRWYFDSIAQECREFEYHGLQGNENNFLSKPDCENSCFANPCSSSNPYRNGGALMQCNPMNPLICPAGQYCHIGGDARTTVCCPALGDPCSQLLNIGNGKLDLARYYFDVSSKSCKLFKYSGSGGNQNNFQSEQECKKSCKVFLNVCGAGEPWLKTSGEPTICTEDSSCPKNYWCHLGSSEETTMCCPGTQLNPCILPLTVGQGLENLPRWFFDIRMKRCTVFTYAGYGGNQNNFRSKEECLNVCPEFLNPCPSGDAMQQPGASGVMMPIFCKHSSIGEYRNTCPQGGWCHLGATEETTVCCPGAQDPCTLSVSIGSGNLQLSRWFYNIQTLNCQQFTYTGTKGNENNFLSRLDCESKCPVFRNPCVAGSPSTDSSGRPKSCSPNNSVNSCGNGFFCHAGSGPETTVCCPSVGNPCELAMSSGLGSHNLPRFYYNPITRQCSSFTYRGTMGNDNNFINEATCAAQCPVFVNPCPGGSQEIARSQYNMPITCAQTRSCPSNSWCHLGASADSTVCCPGSADNRCELPLAVGSGTANLPRWYFNSNTRECVSFQYRGLYGNANSFVNKDECERACPAFINACAGGQPYLVQNKPQLCGPTSSPCPSGYWCHIGASVDTAMCCPGARNPCDIPYTSGTGNSQLQRFYYDYTSRSCITFQYRGLMGNPNNFLSKEDCESSCPVWTNPCPSGMPVMGTNNRPQICNPKGDASCPLNYFCHAGASADTTVCCPAVRNGGCEEAQSQGEGNYALPRWYFDGADRSCKQFTYRGLKGNQNNFVSREDCIKECPVFINPCPGSGSINPQQIMYCNPNSESSCPSNQWCHAGADRDTTICCPNSAEPCTQPQVKGAGPASLSRYSYDPNTRQCLQFAYSGIGGNQNNFLTQVQCEKRCPVFDNPCRRGDPILVGGRPQQCSASQPCPPNYWCHIGTTVDTTVCCQMESENPCVLNLETGNGQASMPRWYYNVLSQQCAQFSYQGLKGNQNDFLSKQDCEKTCRVYINPCSQGEPVLGQDGMPTKCGAGSASSCPKNYWCHFGDSQDTTVCCPGALQNVCEQPMNVGSGGAQLNRFYFNSMSRSCVQFQYRGTKGNQNNFKNLEECQTICPVTPNPCRNGEPMKDPSGRWQQCALVSNRDPCGLGFWCHVGGDQDTTVCCPGSSEPTETCALPMVMGIGNSSLPRWYYNSLTRQCLTFNYRGLYGNQNNFVAKTSCEQYCPVLVNPCSQGQPIQGPNGVPQFCSPNNLSVCSPSTWCHVGADKESSVCCPGAVENVCGLDQDKGSGTHNLPRWYFDQMTKKCLMFAYSGSGGNQNNFISREECLRKCPELQNPCAQGEPAAGPGNKPISCTFSQGCSSGHFCHLGANLDTTVCCTGSLQNACTGLTAVEGSGELALTRWFYDSNARQCRTFLYRGMKGNPNNFLSKDDCEGTCQVFRNPCAAPVQSPIYCSPVSSSCPANQWCHLGDGPETSICCPGSVADPCVQPMNPGSGNSSLPRFYFNSVDNQCYPFTYKGFLGNQNNYLTKSNCESSCIKYPNPCSSGIPLLGPNNQPQSCNGLSTSSTCPSGYWCHVGSSLDSTVCCQGSEDPCKMAMAQGFGEASLPRWYFDQNTKRCTQFNYRGMKGNQNNFVSQDACRVTCREFTNPCIGQPATTPTGQVVFCSATNKDNCPVNFWCHVGAKPETTLCCPGATNPCSVPLAPGTGTESLNRFYYNADSRQCVQYTYNGIGGNQNNFMSKGECEATCPVWTNPCSGGPPATGRANAPLQCSPLNVGPSCPPTYWCHIGASPMDTVCCPGELEKPCLLARSIGNGPDKLPRWYFDSLTKKCQQFEYSGRGGNQNNFITRLDCLKVCPEYENTCLFGVPILDAEGIKPMKCLPDSTQCPTGYFCLLESLYGHCCPAYGDPCTSTKREGDGNAALQRWYYNSASRDCELFQYKGRRGNQNNFLSQEECVRQCVPDINPCFTGDEPYKSNKKNMQCKPGRDSCPPTHYCHIGEDSFATVCCPRRGTPCEQQMLIGTGTAQLQRWYYSREDDECLPFTYSGRGGNENNYLTQQECESSCPGFRGFCPHAKPLLISNIPQECGVETACPNNYVCHINTQKSKSVCCFDPSFFCIQPRDPGPCANHTTRYGYNRDSGTCTPFQFGGCGGNLNNFRSLERCTEICCDKGF